MKWKRIGELFNPAGHNLAPGCVSHARAPQPVELQDRIRVFFCAQTAPVDGKCVSIPQYCDLSKDLKSVLEVSHTSIIELGKLGEFDEHGIFPFSVHASGDEIWAYTTGWSRRVSTPVELAIGLARCKQGDERFKKYGGGGPIMTALGSETCMVGDACVRRYGALWHMWYISSRGWLQQADNADVERTYLIASATSSDGINWNRTGCHIVPTVIPDECQAMPAVFEKDGIYHMVFCFRRTFGFRDIKEAAYRFGYARSYDLVKWERDDAFLGIQRPEHGWDSDMMCYPSVITIENHTYLFYNGNNFGRTGFGALALES